MSKFNIHDLYYINLEFTFAKLDQKVDLLIPKLGVVITGLLAFFKTTVFCCYSNMH